MKPMRVHASLDLRSELMQGRVKGNARKLLTTSICLGDHSLSVVVKVGSRALNTDPDVMSSSPT